MGTVAGTVRGTMRKFSSCGPEQAASANAPAMIDKMFFAFIILKPFTGLDNTANSFSMFHDALHDSCGVHGEKMPEKAATPVQRKISPAPEGGENPPSVTQSPCLITFGLYSTRDCQEGSRLFTVNPLFRIMTKIAKSTFITGA